MDLFWCIFCNRTNLDNIRVKKYQCIEHIDICEDCHKNLPFSHKSICAMSRRIDIDQFLSDEKD